MKKYLISSLAISAALLTPSGGNSGQLMAQALEEVIVTAQRRSESTQDIPVAIHPIDEMEVVAANHIAGLFAEGKGS